MTPAQLPPTDNATNTPKPGGLFGIWQTKDTGPPEEPWEEVLATAAAGQSATDDSERVKEPDLVCSEDPAVWERHMPGIYTLRCTAYKIERVKMYGGAWKLRLLFTSADPHLQCRSELCKFFHLGTGEQPHIGRKSAYLHAWTLANNGQPPRKGASMSPRKFVGKIFRCQVGDVTRTADPKRSHAPAVIYSTVSAILDLIQ